MLQYIAHHLLLQSHLSLLRCAVGAEVGTYSILQVDFYCCVQYDKVHRLLSGPDLLKEVYPTVRDCASELIHSIMYESK